MVITSTVIRNSRLIVISLWNNKSSSEDGHVDTSLEVHTHTHS